MAKVLPLRRSATCPLLQTSLRDHSSFPSRIQSRSASNQGNNKIEPDEILRERAFSWLNGPGKAFQEPSLGPKYLGPGRKPFPLNPFFVSEAVLSEELREAVYQHVAIKGESVRSVSVKFNITMERVAAVVRLKQVEKNWVMAGKELAKPYSTAVLSMLPVTELSDGVVHESISDIPVHPYTTKQIFYPASESRQFTRADASRAFNESLLPADARIPHPQLILEHQEKNELPPTEFQARRNKREHDEQKALVETRQAEQAKISSETTVLATSRATFRFRDARSDLTGPAGRDARGLGYRYGVPSQARRKGVPKYRTQIDA